MKGQNSMSITEEKETAFVFSAASEALSDAFAARYGAGETVFADDGKIGVPVGVRFYHDPAKLSRPGLGGTPLIVYVLGTNTERIGTESDTAIVGRMLEAGTIVCAADYGDSAAACPPALDWSLHDLREKLRRGAYFPPSDSIRPGNYQESYIVPAGYDISFNHIFWSFDRHGTDGTLEKIVEIWNNDFRGTKGDRSIVWSTAKKTTVPFNESDPEFFGGWVDREAGTYRTFVRYTAAERVTDCVKPNGSPIDLNLYMHLIYPTHPAKKVPVMCLASSSEDLPGAWLHADRPHLTGFLLRGYAGVMFDYGYTPMARVDHYAYFDGGKWKGHVTGDGYTYSLNGYNECLSDTAAIRYIRYLIDREGDTYAFDPDRIGVFGNSKAGAISFLGSEGVIPAWTNRYYPGHHGETRFEAGKTADEGIIRGGEQQPWLTYRDGSPIPYRVNFLYQNCGANTFHIREGQAPMYATGSMLDSSYFGFYPEMVNACRIYDVPCVALSVAELGHALCFGRDKDHNVDTYETLFIFADYWLHGAPAACIYTDPSDGARDVPADTAITVKFTGPVPESEIRRVRITDDGDRPVTGIWTSLYGRTEWRFAPDGLADGMRCTVTVPDTLKAENGKRIAAGCRASFTVRGEDILAPVQTAGECLSFLCPPIGDGVSVSLRLSIGNDAANAVELIHEGEAVARIPLCGRRDVSADVTDFVRAHSGETVGLTMRLCHAPGETELVGERWLEDASFGPLTEHETAETDGVPSAVIRRIRTNAGMLYHNEFLKNPAQLLSLPRILAQDSLSEADYGRRFRISLSLYDTVSRPAVVGLSRLAIGGHPELNDWNALRAHLLTKANEWTDVEFLYTVDRSAYWDRNLQKKTLFVDAFASGLDERISVYPISIGKVRTVELFTDVRLNPARPPVLTIRQSDKA